MKSHHYLALGVKLFAIALFVYAIKQSRLLIEVAIDGGINGIPASSWFMLATTAIPFLISAVLWFFPITLAQSILTSELDKTVEPTSPITLLSILISMIGLFFLYYVISDTVYWLIFSHLADGTSASLEPEVKANMWTTLIELVVICFLVLKSKTIAKKMLEVAT